MKGELFGIRSFPPEKPKTSSAKGTVWVLQAVNKDILRTLVRTY